MLGSFGRWLRAWARDQILAGAEEAAQVLVGDDEEGTGKSAELKLRIGAVPRLPASNGNGHRSRARSE